MGTVSALHHVDVLLLALYHSVQVEAAAGLLQIHVDSRGGRGRGSHVVAAHAALQVVDSILVGVGLNHTELVGDAGLGRGNDVQLLIGVGAGHTLGHLAAQIELDDAHVVLDHTLDGDGVAALDLINAVTLHAVALDGGVLNNDVDGDVAIVGIVGSLNVQNLTGQGNFLLQALAVLQLLSGGDDLGGGAQILSSGGNQLGHGDLGAAGLVPSELDGALSIVLFVVEVLDNALNGDGIAGLDLIGAVALHLVALDGLIADLHGQGNAAVLLVVLLNTQNGTGQLSNVRGALVLTQSKSILQDLSLVGNNLQSNGGGVGGVVGATLLTALLAALHGGGGVAAAVHGGGGAVGGVAAVGLVHIDQGAAGLKADHAAVLAQSTGYADVVTHGQTLGALALQTGAQHQLVSGVANLHHNRDGLGGGIPGGLDLGDVTGQRGGASQLAAVGQSIGLVQDLQIAQSAQHLVVEAGGLGLAFLILDGSGSGEQNVGLSHVGQIDEHVVLLIGGADLHRIGSAGGDRNAPLDGIADAIDGDAGQNVLVLIQNHHSALFADLVHILQIGSGVLQSLVILAAAGKERQSQRQNQRYGQYFLHNLIFLSST